MADQPGWYEDPKDLTQLRWWEGTWSDKTRPKPDTTQIGSTSFPTVRMPNNTVDDSLFTAESIEDSSEGDFKGFTSWDGGESFLNTAGSYSQTTLQPGFADKPFSPSANLLSKESFTAAKNRVSPLKEKHFSKPKFNFSKPVFLRIAICFLVLLVALVSYKHITKAPSNDKVQAATYTYIVTARAKNTSLLLQQHCTSDRALAAFAYNLQKDPFAVKKVEAFALVSKNTTINYDITRSGSKATVTATSKASKLVLPLIYEDKHWTVCFKNK